MSSAGNSLSNIDITAILKHTSDQTQGDPLRLRSPPLRLRSSAQDQIDQALLLAPGVERFLQRLRASLTPTVCTLTSVIDVARSIMHLPLAADK
jgi:hypothetical protein